MNILDIETFKELYNHKGENLVSLYMPSHVSGDHTKENPIRLKTLLNNAKRKLLEKGLTEDHIENLISPAQVLLDDNEYWKKQKGGLAIFIDDNFSRVFRLPCAFEERVFVNNRFLLKPLIPLLGNLNEFYVLQLSKNESKLYKGTKFNFLEVNIPGMPRSIDDLDLVKERQQSLQFHSGGEGNKSPMYHGQASVKDFEKERVKSFFKTINSSLQKYFTKKKVPLIVASVNYYFPLYKEINTYPYLSDKFIEGSYDKSTEALLHTKSLELIKDELEESNIKTIEEYKSLANTGKTSSIITELPILAYEGRIKTLLITQDSEVWGSISEDMLNVEIINDHTADDNAEDILDITANETVINKGEVYIIDKDDMPEEALACAILRY